MGNRNEGESKYIVVACTDKLTRRGRIKKLYTAEYSDTNSIKDEASRLAEMARAKRICKVCPLNGKCKPAIFETLSYRNRLSTVTAINGYGLLNPKCRQTRGIQNGLLYANRNYK